MAVAWIDLEGTANTRDLGGLELIDGRRTRSGRLIRSDNLRDLTSADVELLVSDIGVRTVADLRTEFEIAGEGPGPLSLSDAVRIHECSLLPAMELDRLPLRAPSAALLGWRVAEGRSRDGSGHPYLRYLARRPDSVLSALRWIADGEGATVVHCAAGKDRTGVVVAMALEEVGVVRDAVAHDYAATGHRVEAVLERLRRSPVYRPTLTAPDGQPLPAGGLRPSVGSMRRFLDELDALGGVSGWLRRHGWSAQDARALRSKLLDPS